MSDVTLNIADWSGFAHGLQEVPMKCNDGRAIEVEANFSEVIECESSKRQIQAVVVRDCSATKAAMREMQEAKDAAETGNMEKSNFMAFVFHELRNPLHAVIGLNALLIQSLSMTMEEPRSPTGSPLPSGLPAPQAQSSVIAHQEAMEYLAAISDAARMMRVIVNDMRVLSKLEAGTVELEHNVFNLQRLVETVYRNQIAAQDEMIATGETIGNGGGGQMVEIRMQVKGLEGITKDSAVGDAAGAVGLGLQEAISGMPGKDWFPPKVRGDATRIQQVLCNLLSNSLKHTKSGTVYIRAHVQKVREIDSAGRERNAVPSNSAPASGVTRKQACVRFEVEDTGKGIPKSEIPKLFKTVQSAFSEYSSQDQPMDTHITNFWTFIDREVSGTTISLNVVNSLVHMMGGEMHVHSQIGKGTRIWFALWLDVVEGPDNDDCPSPDGGMSLYSIGIGTPYLGGIMRRQSAAASVLYPNGPVLTRTQSSSGDGAQKGTQESSERQVVPGSPSSTYRTPPPRARTISRSASDDPKMPAPATSRRQSMAAIPGPMNNSGISAATSPLRCAISGPPSIGKKKAVGSVRRLGQHPTKDRPIRVLVVEDNDLIQKLAEKMLSRAGFEVRTANNGEEALSKIEAAGENWFDVCLMDLLMPVMDGFQATQEIRNRVWTLPVIALTAKSSECDRLRCLKIGFSYFMTKPFQLGDIATIIRYMVGAEGDQNAVGVNDPGPLLRPIP
ncbi:hypothetical protein HK104_008959 [Borealophlyctis nickersoniae]|nr:hypothetical protein HK104_008959 [Borealophlyctis nickersoniae]